MSVSVEIEIVVVRVVGARVAIIVAVEVKAVTSVTMVGLEVATSIVAEVIIAGTVGVWVGMVTSGVPLVIFVTVGAVVVSGRFKK